MARIVLIAALALIVVCPQSVRGSSASDSNLGESPLHSLGDVTPSDHASGVPLAAAASGHVQNDAAVTAAPKLVILRDFTTHRYGSDAATPVSVRRAVIRLLGRAPSCCGYKISDPHLRDLFAPE